MENDCTESDDRSPRDILIEAMKDFAATHKGRMSAIDLWALAEAANRCDGLQRL